MTAVISRPKLLMPTPDLSVRSFLCNHTVSFPDSDRFVNLGLEVRTMKSRIPDRLTVGTEQEQGNSF